LLGTFKKELEDARAAAQTAVIDSANADAKSALALRAQQQATAQVFVFPSDSMNPPERS
jgi:hypothetical protein